MVKFCYNSSIQLNLGIKAMNEKIKQLAEQAGITDNNLSDGNMSHDDLAKFAELIVQECAEVANDHNSEAEGITLGVGRVIKEHFGVEE